MLKSLIKLSLLGRLFLRKESIKFLVMRMVHDSTPGARFPHAHTMWVGSALSQDVTFLADRPEWPQLILEWMNGIPSIYE